MLELAAGFERSFRSIFRVALPVTGSSPSTCADFAQPMSFRTKASVFRCEFMPPLAMSLTDVVATILFCGSNWLQVSGVYTVCEPAPPVVDMIYGQTRRDRSNPQFISESMCSNSFRFPTYLVCENSIPLTPSVNFSSPQPACVSFVDLPDEQLCGGQPVRSKWSCSFGVSPPTPFGVVRSAPALGLYLLLAAIDLAGSHNLQPTRRR